MHARSLALALAAFALATPAHGQTVAGEWEYRRDPGIVSAVFTPPGGEPLLFVVCDNLPGTISLSFRGRLYPDQDTTLRFRTAAGVADFAAHSYNDVYSRVIAEADGEDPRLDALAAPQQRFTVELAGHATVFPWHDSIPRALAACAD